MTFRLVVDGPRWRRHAAEVAGRYYDAATGAGVVPVVKGNGYGFGQPLLATEAARLGAPVMSVGTVFEAADPGLDPQLIRAGDLLVLTPWDPADAAAADAWVAVRRRWGARLIVTIASVPALAAVATRATPDQPWRIVLEGLTSTRRFGLDITAVTAALGGEAVRAALASGALVLEGLALHLPMAQPDPARVDSRAMLRDPTSGPVEHGSARVREALGWAHRWLADVSAAPGNPGTVLRNAADLWVSHLSPTEAADLRAALPDVPVRPRIGTALWLGDPGSHRAEGVVLAVHPISRLTGGVGYRQRRLRPGSALVVVGGGTSHGVALAAPDPNPPARRRAANAADALLLAAGRARSPFLWNGTHLAFAETPHASVSLVVVPRGVRPPAVGESLACRVRTTTTRFDQITGL